jgi:hypothetical protein
MPIRFRCVYCNQLLGISRRKAGTIVRCTTCDGQLIVPDPSDPATEAANLPDRPAEQRPANASSSEAPAVTGGVFDGSDFDDFLQPLNAGGQAIASPPARRSSASAGSVISPGAGQRAAGAAALVLSRRSMTVAVVGIVLAVGLAFACGLWLGLSQLMPR